MRAPVSTRAVTQRINRRLAADDRQLKATRGERFRHDLGDYYVIDWRHNVVVQTHVDPQDLARELGVLHGYERLAKPGL